MFQTHSFTKGFGLIWGAALIFGSPSTASAGVLLASYSGSYSVVSQQPVSEGIASFQLALSPLFADCSTAGACTELLRAENLGHLATGQTFTLTNQNAVLAAITNGQLDLFSLTMNFGSSFSPSAAGGSSLIFDTALETSYPAGGVEAMTFTIDRLLFQSVSTPMGFGTEAALNYSIRVEGPGTPALPLFPRASFQTSEIFVDPPLATPEPATWLAVACGFLVLGRRKR